MKSLEQQASDILTRYEDAYEYHLHKVDREWIIEAMVELVENNQMHTKDDVIDAFIAGDASDCLLEQDSRLFAEAYYNITFNTKEK